MCVPAAPGEMSNLSSYALRMARLSAQIFGDVVRPTDPKSMKVVKLFSEQPLARREEVYNWYPPHNTYFALMKKLRYLGLYRCCLCLEGGSRDGGGKREGWEFPLLSSRERGEMFSSEEGMCGNRHCCTEGKESKV